jgi:uncharacterized protein (TIGR02271 family)
MATKAHETVVGVFTDHEQARKATHALKDAGFTEDQIGVASAKRHADRADGGIAEDDDDDYTGEGAIAGVATGAGLGALWGLGILAGILPAIGPAIAGGTLGILLSSAAAGAAVAGLAGALVGMGLSREEAEFYEGELKAGRTIVTVNAGQRRADAVRLMRQFGAYDISNKESIHEQESGERATGMAGNTVQAHEEKLRVSKTPVQTGEVKIRKEVHTEHKTLDVPVSHEEVVIERRPASGKEVSASGLKPGQEVRIPVREEEVNVQKETVATEEVSVGKRRVQDTKHVDETLRKEEIKVETEGDAKVRNRRSKKS